MYSFTYTQYYCIYVSQSSQLHVIIITTIRHRCIVVIAQATSTIYD